MTQVLHEYRMLFERLRTGEPGVDPDALGLRSKLGGEPTWIQEDETPTCPACRTEMTFIGQIDSIEHQSAENPHQVNALSDEQRYMFGDVGLIYVFLCLEDLETQSIVQCF